MHKKQPKQTFLKVRQEAELMNFLQDRLQGKSRKGIKSLLSHSQVSVNDKVVSQFNHPLKSGDEVSINWSHVQIRRNLPGLKIVFEDPYLIVVEKMAGVLSIAKDSGHGQTVYRTIRDRVKHDDPRNLIFMVDRLEREASGLMVLAKSKDVQIKLQQAAEMGKIRRIFAATVEGSVEQDKGLLTAYLKENKALNVYAVPQGEGGRKAVSRYEVLMRGETHSLLELTTETERKHQLRVQLKNLGHPISGDKKYGAADRPLNRLALHLKELGFTHPVTGRRLKFTAKVPGGFVRLVK